MGKYSDLQTKVHSVFNSAEWLAEKIKTVPSDFSSTNDKAEEFIRVSILPSDEGLNLSSLAGTCIIEIYTAFGFGPTRANEIADRLDHYLLGTTVNNWCQFGKSTLMPKGQDKDNSLLTCQHYTIPFNLYGV
jgi:hypothetical protein